MNWLHYIACFFAGMFLTNVVPHFVHGISGDRFPTPFAHPPGKGLSSPLVNVLWALLAPPRRNPGRSDGRRDKYGRGIDGSQRLRPGI